MNTDFIPVAKSGDVRPNRLTLVDVDLYGHPIILTRLEGKLYAFNALCPHQLGNLGRGFLYRGEIECPVHGWRFDIGSGQSVYPEGNGLRLRCYEAKEENGLVKIAVGAEPFASGR